MYTALYNTIHTFYLLYVNILFVALSFVNYHPVNYEPQMKAETFIFRPLASCQETKKECSFFDYVLLTVIEKLGK